MLKTNRKSHLGASKEGEPFKKILRGALEKLIFDPEDFESLKEAIYDLSVGRGKPKELRETIVKSRMKMLETILDKFPFLARMLFKKEKLDAFGSDVSALNLEKAVKERNELLTEIGHRVNAISDNLKNKIKM